MNKLVHAAACAALLLAACGPEAPARSAPNQGAKPGPKAAAPGSTSDAAAQPLVRGPGASAHDLYAAKGLACAVCHPCGKRLPGGHAQPWMDTASTGFHAFQANQALAGCTTCHGPALDGAGGTVAVSCAQCHGATWRTDCTLCHGSMTGAAPPKSTWGNAGDAIRVGAHAAHLGATHGLAAAVACTSCHVVPTDALSPGHADGLTATVTFSGPALAPGLIPAWDRASGTCASTYCHGATLSGGTAKTPVWTRTDGTDRACGACHGAPPPVPHPANADCGACHPGYAAAAVNVTTHLNGVVDLGGSGLTCSSCHGGAENAAPPFGTRGETLTTTRAVGAHQRHLLGGALSGPIACAECHAVPTAMQHADGAAQVVFGPLTTTGAVPATWDPATATCASTYCHGAFAGGANAAPVWTRVDGTQAACGTCHGAPPPLPHSQNPACGSCHDGYGAGTVNLAAHVNGVVDVKPMSCSSCHGSAANAAPPLGTLGETDTTSRAVGAHQAHLAAGTLSSPVACEECHAVPTSMTHSDGAVQLVFGPRAKTGGAQPAYDAVAGTCAATYCHGATLRGGGLNQVPSWTGGGAQAACGSCHLAPPPQPHPHTQLCGDCHPGYSLTSVNPATHMDGVIQAENLSCSSCHGDDARVLVSGADGLALAAPPFGTRGETATTDRAVGAHQAHVNRGDGMALPAKCTTCHAVPTSFTHANGASEVRFGALSVMRGATPSFDGQACSNTYCHGATLGRGGTNHTPTWTTPGPLACTTCHGAPPPLPHPQDSDCIRCHPGYTATSARRATHVNGISDFPSSCNACHDNPPNSGQHYEHLQEGIACDRCHAGYTPTTANPTLHRNARQDVTVSGWNASTRTCSSAIGCHGWESWGRSTASQATGCNRCHGSPPDSGEHREHSEYACSRCHGTGYSKTTVNAATHMNGTVDMLQFYARTTLTCSSACHGSGRWGTRGAVTPNCNACHGFPPVAPHPQKTSCHDCHPSMNADGTLTESHNNGTLDVSGQGCASCHGFPPTTTRTGAAHTTDTNCYGCHSTTVDASNQVVPNGTHNDGAVQVGGGGIGTYGCQTCHGDAARTLVAGADAHAKSAPPVGTRGETATSTRAVGAHLAHLNKGTGALASPTVCGECHPVPTTMTHANGSTVFTWGTLARTGGAAPVFDGTALTCASTYCHGATLGAGGTNHTPTWTAGPSQAACGTCHGSPPPAPHTTSTVCGACHAGYTATTVNAAVHIDGKLDVTAQTCGACHGIPPPAPHTTSTTCGSCHPGYTASTVDPVLHIDGKVDVTNLGCTSCHGKAGQTATAAAPLLAAPPVDAAGASTGIRVGAHQKHLVGGTYSSGYPCATCHASVGSYTSGHSDGVRQVGFSGAANTNLRKGSFTAGTGTAAGTCGSTFCHGAVMSRSGGTVGGTLTRPSWTNTITSCTACHTVSASSLPGRHSRHSSYACSECHGSGYSTSAVNKAIHVNGVKNVSGSRITSWNGTSCTTTCHGSQSW